MTSDGPGVSPFDTYLSSGSRFLIELTAWIAGPWAAGDVIGGWAAVVTLAVLLLLPSMFNTPGDKKATGGVATPGPVRIIIEMILLAAAIAGAWTVWPVWLATLVTVVGGVMLISGARRYRWLAEGAPAVSS
jgi:hypothetical protein